MKEKITEDFKKVSKKYKIENPNSQHPLTESFYKQYGAYSKYQIRKIFGSFTEAKKEIFNIVTRNMFNLKVINKDKGIKKYFVTAAIPGGKVDEGFLRSIETYIKENNAQLIILPMVGIYKDAQFHDRILQYTDFFATEFRFNSNLVARDFLINPQVMLPLTRLKRFGQKQESLIVASPKQHMETVRVKANTTPHIIHSTGAISKPQYRHTTAGVLADQDHIMGGLIVEVENDSIFHIRQIQAGKDGTFYDLNKHYMHNSVDSCTAKVCVIGDSHSLYEDKIATTTFKAWCKKVQPNYIVFHDIFDAKSISHHLENNITEQVNRPINGQFLEQELEIAAKYLCEWRNELPYSTFIIVRSNHDEHLDRYLNECRFVNDRFNYKVSLELAGYLLDKKNPIEEWINKRYNMNEIKWLKRDEDFIIEGVQLGAHGDMVSLGWGKQDSIRKAEEAYGKAIIGHGHCPKIFREVYMVGTSCLEDLGYNTGPSASLQTSCALYNGGQRQLITNIKGHYYIN